MLFPCRIARDTQSEETIVDTALQAQRQHILDQLSDSDSSVSSPLWTSPDRKPPLPVISTASPTKAGVKLESLFGKTPSQTDSEVFTELPLENVPLEAKLEVEKDSMDFEYNNNINVEHNNNKDLVDVKMEERVPELVTTQKKEPVFINSHKKQITIVTAKETLGDLGGENHIPRVDDVRNKKSRPGKGEKTKQAGMLLDKCQISNEKEIPRSEDSVLNGDDLSNGIIKTEISVEKIDSEPKKTKETSKGKVAELIKRSESIASKEQFPDNEEGTTTKKKLDKQKKLDSKKKDDQSKIDSQDQDHKKKYDLRKKESKKTTDSKEKSNNPRDDSAKDQKKKQSRKDLGLRDSESKTDHLRDPNDQVKTQTDEMMISKEDDFKGLPKKNDDLQQNLISFNENKDDFTKENNEVIDEPPPVDHQEEKAEIPDKTEEIFQIQSQDPVSQNCEETVLEGESTNLQPFKSADQIQFEDQSGVVEIEVVTTETFLLPEDAPKKRKLSTEDTEESQPKQYKTDLTVEPNKVPFNLLCDEELFSSSESTVVTQEKPESSEKEKELENTNVSVELDDNMRNLFQSPKENAADTSYYISETLMKDLELSNITTDTSSFLENSVSLSNISSGPSNTKNISTSSREYIIEAVDENVTNVTIFRKKRKGKKNPKK